MKSTFLYQDTQFPAYLQFPKFLLRLPISQTAKVVYLVLYDRSRLSMKNEWTDEYGRVYVVFPIVELAKKIGKSESTVKAGMKELCEAGLLVKRSGGFSKPNYLYVKYALEGQFSDRVRKASAVGSKSNTSDSQDSDLSTGRYPAPNKVMNHSNPTYNYGVMDRKPRGRYGNIFLSDKELAEWETDNALLQQEVSVRMLNLSDVMNATFESREELLREVRQCSLLVIDDYGMERDTEFGNEIAFQVIDARYQSRKPLIVTTNLSLNTLTRPKDTDHKRVYDRILEMCSPVHFEGTSLRPNIRKHKMDRLGEILGIKKKGKE